MKISIDCEFTGLKKNTTLISIGLVSEDNRYFYAEFIDFSISDVMNNDFLLNQIIPQLNFITFDNVKEWWDKYWSIDIDYNKIISNDESKFTMVGTIFSVEKELRKWLSQFDDIEIICDVGHYDMVLLLDIFNGALNCPSNMSPCYIELNNIIAEKYHCSQKEAFNMSREKIAQNSTDSLNDATNKHNSLYDAHIQMVIYKYLTNR